MKFLTIFFFFLKSPLFKMLTNKITIIVMLSFNIFHIHFLFQKKKMFHIHLSFVTLYIYIKFMLTFFFFF